MNVIRPRCADSLSGEVGRERKKVVKTNDLNKMNCNYRMVYILPYINFIKTIQKQYAQHIETDRKAHV